MLRTTHLEDRVVPTVVLNSTTFDTAINYNTFNSVGVNGAVALEVVPFSTDGTTPTFLRNGKPIGGSLLGLYFGNRPDAQGLGFVVRRFNVDGTDYLTPQGGNQEIRLTSNDSGVTGQILLNARADGTYAFIVNQNGVLTFNLYGPKPVPSNDIYGPDDFPLQPQVQLTGVPPTLLNNTPAGLPVGTPATQIKFKPDGSFIAYWQAGRDLVAQLYTNRGQASGGLITLNTPASADPPVANNGNGYLRSQPSLDFAADGSFVAAYTVFGKDTFADGVYFRRFTATGVAKDAIEIEANPSVRELYQFGFGGNENRPTVIVSADGSFIITYHEIVGGTFDAQLNAFVSVTGLTGVAFNAAGQRIIVDPSITDPTDPDRILIEIADPRGFVIDPLRQPGDPNPPPTPFPTGSQIGDVVMHKLPGGQFVLRYEVRNTTTRIGYAFQIYRADGTLPQGITDQSVLFFAYKTTPQTMALDFGFNLIPAYPPIPTANFAGTPPSISLAINSSYGVSHLYQAYDITDDAPVISNALPSTLTLTEDMPMSFNYATVPGIFTDDFTISSRLTVSVGTISNPALVAVTVVNGALIFTPLPDANNIKSGGPATVTIVVSDDTGHSTSKTITVNVTPVDDLPRITPVPVTSINENVTSTLQIMGVDPDSPPNGPLTYSISGQPSWASINPATGVITFTPGEADGPTQVTFTVSVLDTQGVTATTPVTIRVLEVNTPPVVQPIANAQLNEFGFLRIPIIATDSDLPANTLTYSVVNSPAYARATFDGFVELRPGELDGGTTRTITVRVSDGVGFTDVQFQVTVFETNSAPVIPNPGTLQARANNTLTYFIGASDPDVPVQTITYALLTPVPNLTLDAATGLLTFTPTDAQAGATYTLIVRVTDSLGAATDSQFLLAVTANTPPLLPTIPAQQARVGRTLVINSTATDPDRPVQTIFYSLTQAPANMAIDALTGQIFFTPTADQAGRGFTVVVRATDSAGAASEKAFDVGVANASGQVIGGGGQVINPGIQTRYAVAGASGPLVSVYDSAGQLVQIFYAFDSNYTGSITLATGDVDGDGIEDTIVSTGSLGLPEVRVFSGRTGDLLVSFFAYSTQYLGGVSVAAGDVNGDGIAEIITGSLFGATHVQIFNIAAQSVASYFAIPGYTSGITVSAGDTTGDLRANVIVGAASGPALVGVYDGLSGGALALFFGLGGAPGGANVAAVDLDGNGISEIAVAGRTGPAMAELYNSAGTGFNSAGPFGNVDGGLSVASIRRPGTAAQTLLLTRSSPSSPLVRGFRGLGLDADPLYDLVPLSGIPINGVFVG